MKLSDLVWEWLSEKGINTVFMVPGGGAMHLVDSLKNYPIRIVSCLHEQAAAYAAVSYAHLTGIPGVVLVTSGPGGTNAISGVLASWMDLQPLIVISGNCKVEGLRLNDASEDLRSLGSQEANITTIVTPITKFQSLVIDEKNIGFALATAWQRATELRPGPSWIDIPVDIQAKNIDKHEVTIPSSWEVRLGLEKPPVPITYIKDVIKKLLVAKRPVLMLGWGAIDLPAQEALDVLLDKLPNLPVLLTWKAMELLPEDHRNYMGRPGGIGQRHANWTLYYSDLIIFVGCRLDQDQVAFNKAEMTNPYCEKYIVDLSYSELKKNFNMPNSNAIWCDAGDFLSTLGKDIHSAERWSNWHQLCSTWKANYQVEPIIHPVGTVDIYEFTWLLSHYCNEGETVVFGSSGPCANVAGQIWKVKWGQRFIFEPGIGAMGLGLPEAIGAAIANENQGSRKRVVLWNGDGGFNVNIQELAVVAGLNLNIKMFISSNGGYASIAAMQRRNFGRLVGADERSGLFLPDLKKVARAYGIPAFKISGGNVTSKINSALESDGPILVEVMTDPMLEQQPRVISQIVDGKFIPGTIWNMWPYLDNEELKRIAEEAYSIT